MKNLEAPEPLRFLLYSRSIFCNCILYVDVYRFGVEWSSYDAYFET